MTEISGSCLCGDVSYSGDADVKMVINCHCSDCQKATGSGKATIIFIPTEALKFEGDYKTYSVIGTDGSHVSRGFCPECGSPVISYAEEQPDVRFIKAGSLDDPSWVRVAASYWGDSAHEWSPVDDSLPSFAGNPA